MKVRIEGMEFIKGIVQREKRIRIGGIRGRRHVRMIKVNPLTPPAALPAAHKPGALDQDAAHRLRRGRKKVARILPERGGLAVQPQVDLVNQGGGLKGQSGPFMLHPVPCQVVQLLIYDRKDLAGGARQMDRRSGGTRRRIRRLVRKFLPHRDWIVAQSPVAAKSDPLETPVAGGPSLTDACWIAKGALDA